ncbi:MAG: hypothetical protein JOZ69_00235 [Myxococcales bacterium]|nr:hypothetical protein [Myxococcales bacterium]
MTELEKMDPASLRIEPSSQTITARPPYDPEEFARDTDSKIVLSDASALAPTVPPPPGLPEYPIDVGAAASDLGTRALSGDSVPVLAVDWSELDWFELPAEVHLLLLHVNGSDSVATISGIVGVALAEALAVLGELARDGLVIESRGTPA